MDKNRNKSIVSANIKQIIKNKGMTQIAVSEKAGLDYDSLNNMLNGRKLVGSEDIIKLIPVLGVTPNDLFRGTF
ncbi:MAG TPA: helix-turn-helix transcriptional regulator [Thermoclostridium sp.]|nr:helix-turn-helix transcriptional regulator [Thermoclostridium sp.]